MTDKRYKAPRKLPHRVIIRAPGLLPMMYRVRELAAELDVSPCAIRAWTRNGVPYQRDSRGHLWIDGRDLARWVEERRAAKHGLTLAEDEAYCLRCQKAVKLVDPTRQVEGRRVLLQAICPQCGARVNRGVSYGESE